MKVCLIDIDSVIPNLALHKVAKYHLDRGDQVIWNAPLFGYDLAYVSCIFDFNRHRCREWEGRGNVKIGGSGYDLSVCLPEDIEQVKPRINLGFTTRGCIRKCRFCIVPRKEGQIRVVGDIYDLWDGVARKITLLDNNILALPQHFIRICQQVKQEGLTVEFNQGLDIRLLTDELCAVLADISVDRIKFAFDDMSYVDSVYRGVKILKKYGLSPAMFLVYTDGDFEDCLERLLILKRLGQRGYVMRDWSVHYEPKMMLLASWCNSVDCFVKMDFYDYWMKYKSKVADRSPGLFGRTFISQPPLSG